MARSPADTVLLAEVSDTSSAGTSGAAGTLARARAAARRSSEVFSSKGFGSSCASSEAGVRGSLRRGLGRRPAPGWHAPRVSRPGPRVWVPHPAPCPPPRCQTPRTQTPPTQPPRSQTPPTEPGPPPRRQTAPTEIPPTETPPTEPGHPPRRPPPRCQTPPTPTPPTPAPPGRYRGLEDLRWRDLGCRTRLGVRARPRVQAAGGPGPAGGAQSWNREGGAPRRVRAGRPPRLRSCRRCPGARVRAGLGRGTSAGRTARDDALHQRLARRLEADEAEGHPGALTRGGRADDHPLAAEERAPVGENQVEEELRPDRLGCARGEEESVTAHVGAVLVDELVLAAEGQPDAEWRRREHGRGAKMPRIRALPKS